MCLPIILSVSAAPAKLAEVPDANPVKRMTPPGVLAGWMPLFISLRVALKATLPKVCTPSGLGPGPSPEGVISALLRVAQTLVFRTPRTIAESRSVDCGGVTRRGGILGRGEPS